MRVEQDVSRLQQKLEIAEGVYKIAKARVDGTDKDWESEKSRIHDEIAGLALQYNMGDPPEKAVYILGMMRAAARRLQQPSVLVAEYESDKHLLNRRLAELNEKRKMVKEDH